MTPPSPPAKDLSTAVKSAERVLDLFELFARRGREMSHSEIAEHLGIPKSSLSQLLATLTARGYLALSADTRAYRLGQSLLALARQQAQARDLPTLARPVLQDLTLACGESSALNLRSGDESVVAAAVMGPQRLVSQMKEGDRAPLYATSGGKALLAWMPEDQRRDYLARVRFERFTPHTLASPAALKKQLLQVRHGGVAYSREEYTPGIVGMAAAVVQDGVPLAALNIAMPAVRFSDAVNQRAAALLAGAAQALGRLAS